MTLWIAFQTDLSKEGRQTWLVRPSLRPLGAQFFELRIISDCRGGLILSGCSTSPNNRRSSAKWINGLDQAPERRARLGNRAVKLNFGTWKSPALRLRVTIGIFLAQLTGLCRHIREVLTRFDDGLGQFAHPSRRIPRILVIIWLYHPATWWISSVAETDHVSEWQPLWVGG